MKSSGGRSPLPATRSLVKRPGSARITVIGGSVVTNHPFPPSNRAVIGRDSECDVHIDHPSVSRRHAEIRLLPDGTLTVADLGSSNGTHLRGRAIGSESPSALAFDEMLTIGAMGVVVQHTQLAPRQRTVWGHGYFELRLNEECARAERAGATFGLLRIRVPGDPEAAVDRIGSAIRELDVIGNYAPGEWEVLVLDASPDDIEHVAGAVRTAVEHAELGVATFPADGRDAWALATAATAKLGAERGRARRPSFSIDPRQGPMRAVFELIDRVAVGDISVLILGETGVGKEVIAEQVHARSKRAAKQLLKLNCAAMPEQLLESELFGHEKGAFTGATATKPGLLEQADGGSVFLDEIGELPAATQAKLLRVIEQRELLRVGALKPRAIDVRFIAATHRDLEAAIAGGSFREDLYFRLAGVTITVPPLRERGDELAGLASKFAERAAKGLGRDPPKISPAALHLLGSYRWPGNIRELRNVIERATLLCDGVIEPQHLPEDRMSLRPAAIAVAAVTAGGGNATLRAHNELTERQAIQDALDRCNGNQTEAAQLLGISRRTLTNKLNQYGFERPRKGR